MIKIGDVVGEVIETRLQVTHLRSVKNEELIIPNSQILDERGRQLQLAGSKRVA